MKGLCCIQGDERGQSRRGGGTRHGGGAGHPCSFIFGAANARSYAWSVHRGDRGGARPRMGVWGNKKAVEVGSPGGGLIQHHEYTSNITKGVSLRREGKRGGEGSEGKEEKQRI